MNRRLLIYSIVSIFIIILIYFLVFYENCEAFAQYPAIVGEPSEYYNPNLEKPLIISTAKEQPTDIISSKNNVTETSDMPC